MKVNSCENQSFGQIYASPKTVKLIRKLVRKQDKVFKEMFSKHWEECRNTTFSDLYISEKARVFIRNKMDGREMEEKPL